MNKRMYGFVEPFTLGLILSLVGVVLIQLTEKETKEDVIASQQYESKVNTSVSQMAPAMIIEHSKLIKQVN